MLQFVPAPVQRALMPLAHRLRHRWRKWRKVPIAGVSAVICNPQSEVLLLRHSYGPEVWALPGGGLKPGEDPEDCARREIREELGIELAKLERVAVVEEVLSESSHTAHIFSAVSDGCPVPDRREVIEARFFPVESLPEPLGRLTRRRIEAWKRGQEERG